VTLSAQAKKVGAGVVIALALLGGSFYAGRYTAPVKTVTEWKEKVVEKEKLVETEAKVVERVITIREAPPVLQPKQPEPVPGCPACIECVPCPGIKETVVQETEHSTTKREAESTKVAERGGKTSVESFRPRFSLGGAVETNAKDLLKGEFNPSYEGRGEIRVVGPLWVGVSLNTAGYVGVGARLEF
jgi:hypothetical protein